MPANPQAKLRATCMSTIRRSAKPHLSIEACAECLRTDTDHPHTGNINMMHKEGCPALQIQAPTKTQQGNLSLAWRPICVPSVAQTWHE